MGLGLKGKKTYTASSIGYNELFEGIDPASGIKTAILRSIKHSTDIADEIIKMGNTGSTLRFDKYYREGKNVASVTAKSTFQNSDLNAVDQTALIASISAATGHTGIDIKYAHSAPLNPFHVIFTRLATSHGYVAYSNTSTTLSTSLGYDVKLYNMHLYCPSSYSAYVEVSNGMSWADGFQNKPTNGNDSYMGFRSHSITINEFITTPYMDVAFSYYVPVYDRLGGFLRNDLKIVNAIIYLPEILDVINYAQVRYTHSGGESYWTYDYSTQAYPAMNGLVNMDFVDVTDNFPIVTFMVNGEYTYPLANQYQTEYEKVDKLLGILGLNIKDINSQFYASDEDKNLHKAALLNAVSLNTDDPREIDYLLNHFTMIDDRISNKNAFSGPLYGGSSSQEYSFEYNIGDDYGFTFNFYRLLSGFSGVPGFKNPLTGKWSFSEQPVGKCIRVTGTSSIRDAVTINGVKYKRTIPFVEYRKYVTPRVFKFARVYAPVMWFPIGAGETQVSDFDDDDCYLPINREALRKLNYADRNYVISKSFKFQVSSYSSVSVAKWKTKKWFVYTIGAIIVVSVTLLSGGTATGPVAAALAGAGLTGTVLLAATILLESLILSLALDFIAKNVSADIMAITAVIALIWGGTQAITGATPITPLATSNNLLQISNSLSQASDAKYATDADKVYKKIQTDEAEYGYIIDALTEITDSYDNKDLAKVLNYTAVSPKIVPITLLGESPQSYYDRAIHSGNIGTLVLNIPSTYHANALALPTPHETIKRGIQYG